MLARRNLCWYASATLRTARRAGVRPHSSARETPGESSQPAPASSGNCGTWNSELGDGALPKHVPKFLRDAMQGLDPQLGELMVLELTAESGRCVERRLSKRELAQTAGVQPRDLRKVLSVSKRRLISGIAVRRHCIIVHLEHIKAIVMKDRMLLFDHARDSRAQAFARFLPSLVHDIGLTSGGKVTFEFRVLEAVLIEVTESLDSLLKEMTPRMLELLTDLTRVQSAENLSALVSATDSLSAVDARVQSLRHALTELLNNDEDLSSLYLNEKREVADHNEAELLLENYLMQVDETMERISELQTRFNNITSYIQIHFDSQRNRLMRMNLIATFGSLSVASTACGASVFGMNLLSGFEDHPSAFYAVTGSLTSLGLAAFLGSYMFYRRTKAPLPGLANAHSSKFSPPRGGGAASTSAAVSAPDATRATDAIKPITASAQSFASVVHAAAQTPSTAATEASEREERKRDERKRSEERGESRSNSALALDRLEVLLSERKPNVFRYVKASDALLAADDSLTDKGVGRLLSKFADSKSGIIGDVELVKLDADDVSQWFFKLRSTTSDEDVQRFAHRVFSRESRSQSDRLLPTSD